MFRAFAGVVLVFTLVGCASTTGTFFNRPVVEDRVGDTLHTVSLSSDRRTVIVARAGQANPMFCAEPPPDTATALKTDLDSTLKAKGAELGIKDKFDTSVTVLASRNAPLDAFRTGMFALCQFYMNGAISSQQVPGLFKELLVVFKDTQNLVTETPRTPPAASTAANPDVASANATQSIRKASK